MGSEVKVFKLLASEIRLNIAMAIFKQAGVWINVGGIQKATGYYQPIVSQQLAIFRASGVVDTKRVGAKVYYRFNNTLIERLLSNVKNNRHSDDG